MYFLYTRTLQPSNGFGVPYLTTEITFLVYSCLAKLFTNSSWEGSLDFALKMELTSFKLSAEILAISFLRAEKLRDEGPLPVVVGPWILVRLLREDVPLWTDL